MKLSRKYLIYLLLTANSHASTIDDKSRLNQTEVSQIMTIPAEEGVQPLQRIIKESLTRQKKISIRGTQHTQGGHTFSSQGIVLDLNKLKKIERLTPDTIRVQAGMLTPINQTTR